MRSIDSDDTEHHETPGTLTERRKKNKKKWYAREDLNLHVLGHQNLNLARFYSRVFHDVLIGLFLA